MFYRKLFYFILFILRIFIQELSFSHKHMNKTHDNTVIINLLFLIESNSNIANNTSYVILRI